MIIISDPVGEGIGKSEDSFNTSGAFGSGDFVSEAFNIVSNVR